MRKRNGQRDGDLSRKVFEHSQSPRLICLRGGTTFKKLTTSRTETTPKGTRCSTGTLRGGRQVSATDAAVGFHRDSSRTISYQRLTVFGGPGQSYLIPMTGVHHG